MKKGFWIVALITVALSASSAAAATFPITELGDCRDQKECRLFCEVPANKAACWSYQNYRQTSGSVLGETTDDTLATSPAPTPLALFPIAELGGCSDVKTCKAYCDLPDNFTACQQVAKKHGLTRAATSGQQTALLAHAKQELGCTSLQQCRAFCAEPTNSEQCQALAEKYGPVKYRLAHQTLLQKAQTILGCASAQECRALCEQETHKAQCRLFAQEHTPTPFQRKLEELKAERKNQAAPLPCTTLADCQTYCSDPANALACKMSAEKGQTKLQLQQEATKTCTTAAECEQYCQTNPDQCPAYKESTDYKNVQRQRELRLKNADQPATRKDLDLERYRRSLITPSVLDSTPAN